MATVIKCGLKKKNYTGLKCITHCFNKHFISKYQRIVKLNILFIFRNNLVIFEKLNFKQFLLISQVHIKPKNRENR